MIKIFTNHDYLIKDNKGRYFPLFEELIDHPDSKLKNKYCFVDSIEACDILVLPLFIDYLLENNERYFINQFKSLALINKKPLWVFASGDFGLTINEDFVHVFKMADFKSTKSERTIIMPAFINDPYETIYHSEVSYLSKSSEPIVGYVGHAKGGVIKYFKFLINFLLYNFKVLIRKKHSDYFRPYSSSHKRLKYLKILLRAKGIKTNFIFRDKYRAGAKNKLERATTTLEFFDNIKSSHYTFCMRGFGNFSVRLYETLAMGRIPLQIDTDCCLPLSEFINWNQHCILIDEKHVRSIGESVLKFNNEISNDQFLELQKKNRLFWENYLTRVSYFSFIHDLFTDGRI